MSQSLEFNIAKVRQRIRDAEQKYRREPNSVQLLIASKTQPAALIRRAAAAGVTEIAENYLQEALDKQAELADLALCWHFIGPIQSNKTRAIAEHFDWVHSVERVKIARRLSEQRPPGLAPLNICLQINISAEPTKSGILLQELGPMADHIMRLPNLRLRGLMAIPKACDNVASQRRVFARLATAAGELQRQCPGVDTLSMGMSNDLEAAVAEGATMVRIGTAIFGPRQ